MYSLRNYGHHNCWTDDVVLTWWRSLVLDHWSKSDIKLIFHRITFILEILRHFRFSMITVQPHFETSLYGKWASLIICYLPETEGAESLDYMLSTPLNCLMTLCTNSARGARGCLAVQWRPLVQRNRSIARFASSSLVLRIACRCCLTIWNPWQLALNWQVQLF